MVSDVRAYNIRPKNVLHVPLAEFLYLVATKKKNQQGLTFIYIRVPESGYGEAMQLLDFHMVATGAALVELKPKTEFLVVAHVKSTTACASFEKEMNASFTKEDCRVDVRLFSAGTIEWMNKLLAPYAVDNPVVALCLRRALRMGNTVVVLDDDMMVLRLIQNTMAGSGNVIVAQDCDEFIKNYRDYAPNIAFIDIHLQSATTGVDIAEKIIDEVDPYAHIIMISSDGMPKTIQGLKGKGVRGFVLKPIQRMALLDHLTKSPTFNMRA